MGLRLHNTLTRTKEDFVPIDPRNVRMYVCGPTVYDFAHIGNARPLIVFDVLFRLLKHLYPGAGTAADGSRVTYVRNITDVDDKINTRAAEEYPGLPLNEAIRKVTETTEKQFHEDVAALGCLKPTFEPRATEYVSKPDAPEDMIRLTQKLIDRKCAYVEQGHVLFDVKSMPDYGKLSNRSLDDMIAGARVEVAPYKKDPMDFVLWKPSKLGEPSWPSPWGAGRPGWHLECSAMAGALLGETFDIHGGGIDLVFPHHENEIAQSRCAHGTPLMAKYWLHNGFLQVEGEKMSKSLGNFVTVRELLDQGWDGRVIRLHMLRTHYRQPINWTHDGLVQSALDLPSFTKWMSDGPPRQEAIPTDNPIFDALQDDLNTPQAIAECFALVERLKGRTKSDLKLEQDVARLWIGLDTMGLSNIGNYNPNPMFARLRGIGNEQAREADRLVDARAAARARKDFAEADRIRAELDAMGIALKDSKDPKTGEMTTTWEVKR
jgi:cysteinyl-tRNA synthetase